MHELLQKSFMKLTPEANVISLFTPTSYEFLFVPGKLLQPSLMFAGKFYNIGPWC
jgi:hypothetical protein